MGRSRVAGWPLGGTHDKTRPSMPRKTPETRKQTRERKRREWIAAHPHPYHEWHDVADAISHRVAGAVEGQVFRWRKGKTDRERTLTIQDLALGLWSVECTSDEGLNYGQLDFAFRSCIGVGCHRSKAAAVLSALQSLGLIHKTGNYSAGGRGNVYRVAKT